MTETRQSYQALADHVPAVIYTAQQGERAGTLYVNGHVEAMLGFTPGEWLAQPDLWYRQVHPEDRDRIASSYTRLRPGDKAISCEYRIHKRDGQEIWVRDYVRLLAPEGSETPVYEGVMVEITAEKRALSHLEESEARYRDLFASNPNPMWIYDLDTLRFLAVNDAAVALYGYSRDEFLAMTIKDIRPPEDVPRLLENVRRVSRGLDRAGLWRHVKKDGALLDVEITSHTVDYGGRKAETVLVRDLTEQVEARRRIDDYIARMERVIDATAIAVADVVELRDPYTAGHEFRVGEIAAGIAAEMGLDGHMQRGLRVAGSLHDVGKVAVPGEILVKPTRLTSQEFALVKGHCRAGFEVLKGIEFPWPVAEVALQHHERMDGSGYPDGLKGEGIILEARIIAVADVIEAMASHRPYRPAVGVASALDEIEQYSGRKYDTEVASAALTLFRQREFRIPPHRGTATGIDARD